jgi:hypothetical protein
MRRLLYLLRCALIGLLVGCGVGYGIVHGAQALGIGPGHLGAMSPAEQRLATITERLSGKRVHLYCDLDSLHVLGETQIQRGVVHVSRDECAMLTGVKQDYGLKLLSPAYCAVAPDCARSLFLIADAALVIAHESAHVSGVRPEDQTECLGLSRVQETLTLLGLNRFAARLAAIGAYQWTHPKLLPEYNGPCTQSAARAARLDSLRFRYSGWLVQLPSEAKVTRFYQGHGEALLSMKRL